MTDAIDRQTVNRYLAMTDDELLAQIVPKDDQLVFSEGGRRARGREVFQELRAEIAEHVCPTYRRHKDAMGDSFDLVLLIAGALTAPALAWGVPLLPLSVLVVKIGLNVLCCASS